MFVTRKWLEDLLPLTLGDANATVAHTNESMVGIEIPDFDLDIAAARGVSDRVEDEVARIR